MLLFFFLVLGFRVWGFFILRLPGRCSGFLWGVPEGFLGVFEAFRVIRVVRGLKGLGLGRLQVGRYGYRSQKRRSRSPFYPKLPIKPEP